MFQNFSFLYSRSCSDNDIFLYGVKRYVSYSFKLSDDLEIYIYLTINHQNRTETAFLIILSFRQMKFMICNFYFTECTYKQQTIVDEEGASIEILDTAGQSLVGSTADMDISITCVCFKYCLKCYQTYHRSTCSHIQSRNE